MSSVKENTLPEGWENKELGDICDVIGGGTPKTKISEYWDGEIVWLSPIDLPPIGEISFVSDSRKKITDLGLNKSSAKLLPKGSVIYSTRASIGKIAIAEIPLSTNQGFTNFICNERINNHFLCYSLKHFNKTIEGLSNSTTFKEVSKTAIKSFKIPLPPLEEQKRIVAKIDTLFAKIDKAISLTEESLVQGKNLLPSVLKEVFEKGKADGWEEKKLGEIAFLKSGSTPRRSNKSYWEGGTIPWLKSGELNDSMEIKENSEFISEIALDETSVKLFTKDTLLIAMYGATAGKLGILSIDATTNQAVCSIQNKKEMFNNHFMFYFLYSIREKIISDSFGGAQPNISKTYLENLSLYIPNLSAQEELASLCDELSIKAKQTQSKLEEQLAYLKQLKSSILSKAFKGEL